MKLWDIVKTVGSSVISKTVPGGSLIIDGINALLPDDKHLPDDATGNQVNTAISNLPPEQQAQVLNKEYDVKKEQIKQSHSSLQTMLEANATSVHTTRPKIAYQAWLIVGFVTVLFGVGWFIAVVTGDNEMVKSIKDSYMFVGFLLTPLIVWLNAYFGVLRNESVDKMNAAQGYKVDPVGGLIGKLFKR